MVAVITLFSLKEFSVLGSQLSCFSVVLPLPQKASKSSFPLPKNHSHILSAIHSSVHTAPSSGISGTSWLFWGASSPPVGWHRGCGSILRCQIHALRSQLHRPHGLAVVLLTGHWYALMCEWGSHSFKAAQSKSPITSTRRLSSSKPQETQPHQHVHLHMPTWGRWVHRCQFYLEIALSIS